MDRAMPLQGTFDVLDFTEVLHLLGRLGATGRLHVRSRSVTANLFLEEGAVVGADQSDHQPAAATGDVRSRLEEVCFELLEADRGSFEFQPGKATSLPGAVRLKVEDVLARARVRLDEWRALTDRVPSLDVHPQIVTDLNVTEVTLDKERWRMLTTIDGRRNLRAIGRVLNLSDFEACRLLVDLLDAGVVDLDDAAKAAAGNRDLVPTIPLPEKMAETAADPGDGEVESVTVTRPRPVAAPPAPDRARPSDDAKRVATRPTTVGTPRPVPAPGAPGTATGPVPEPPGEAAAPEAAEPSDAAEAAGPPAGDDPPRGRRRARRRTPGGPSTVDDGPTPDSDVDASAGPKPGVVAPEAGPGPVPAEAAAPAMDTGAPGPEGEEPGGRRPRRVIRIRSRAEPRNR
jgi:hypothetical protein